MIRLPFLHRHRAVPLKKCIEMTARDSGYSEPEVARIMTYFLESIADEVSKGRAISIPGFGMFVQTCIRWNRKTLYRPGFIPARGFRNQVRLGLRPDAVTTKAKQTYKDNQTGALDKEKGDRTFTVMQRFRDSISAQLRK